MKQVRKIICLVFLAIAVVALFLPIATFKDDTAGAMAADIEKQQGKVESAQSQLDRWIAGGKKSEEDIAKQRAKVERNRASWMSFWPSRPPRVRRAPAV